MSSPPSGSEATAFAQLDPRIQRWIWDQGWTSLRAVQERAAAPLLGGKVDAILAAATSAGKTEAAFFPLLTRLVRGEDAGGFILSLSPLKALINDQVQRLTPVCEMLGLPLVGWHGDVAAARKAKFLKSLRGVLIMTPESLEALFVNRGTLVPAFASAARCVVIDELHAFLGSERGKQVQSQLARLERAAGGRKPRIGLSATLGDMDIAAEFLRPGDAQSVEIVDASGEGFDLRLSVKAYVDDWHLPSKAKPEAAQDQEELEEVAEERERHAAKFAIGDELFRVLRGSNNLVFPNSRQAVEFYADMLRRRCEQENVPNEFWPHHGSLSRELREESEAALKEGATTASAICTTTLELGIDIGNIRSVAQIGAPPSVASLRQRLGRSGRRAGEPAILRCFVTEKKLDDSSPFSDRIRETLVQTIAMIELLIRRWVEPPRPDALHASTLVQQLLSVIAQHGGSRVPELWDTLVRSGTFREFSREDFLSILRELGRLDVLQQESGGSLLPTPKGEQMIGRFEFYSAFTSGDEFRLVAEGRPLGSLPVQRPLVAGQRVIFGGRRWRVLDIDHNKRVIDVQRDRSGAPPAFDGLAGKVHDCVREEMRRVLAGSENFEYLDGKASALLEEARAWYRKAGLEGRTIYRDGHDSLLLTWRGDWTQDALALLLTAMGLEATNDGVVVRVASSDEDRIVRALKGIAEESCAPASALRLKSEATIKEKWDWALPADLRLRSYTSSELDLEGACKLCRLLSESEYPSFLR